MIAPTHHRSADHLFDPSSPASSLMHSDLGTSPASTSIHSGCGSVDGIPLAVAGRGHGVATVASVTPGLTMVCAPDVLNSAAVAAGGAAGNGSRPDSQQSSHSNHSSRSVGRLSHGSADMYATQFDSLGRGLHGLSADDPALNVEWLDLMGSSSTNSTLERSTGINPNLRVIQQVPQHHTSLQNMAIAQDNTMMTQDTLMQFGLPAQELSPWRFGER